MATAKALGVKIKKIVKFYEDDNYYPPISPYRVGVAKAISESTMPNADIMAGEEVVNSSVTITFEFE